jgi:hypothetical protein
MGAESWDTDICTPHLKVAPAAADSDGAAQGTTFPLAGDPAIPAAARRQRIA